MLEFLKSYKQAIDVDDKKYDCYFPKGVHRSDVLLLDKQIVCEHKEFQKIKIQSKVEELFQKGSISEKDVKSNLYKRIDEYLSKANKQIRDTKRVFECQDALGLVVLENSIQNDLSVLSLIDAASRKMYRGLDSVDCVLCLDFVNTFSNPDGSNVVRPAQVVTRDTERSRKLCDLLDELMKDFCEQSNTPFLEGFDLEGGDQVWLTDTQGKYKKYQAKVDFKLPILEVKPNWKQRLTQFLNKWWWLIPLPAIFYDWFIK
jgi:hypothetical protein